MGRLKKTEPLTNEQRRTLEPIKSLISFLNAPADLTGLMKVTQEFSEVLKLFLPIANLKTRSDLNRVASAVSITLDHHSKVSLLLRRLVSPTERHRSTLVNYYGTHPHYSIYWHRCENPAHVQQYRALLASLLPVNYRLGQIKYQTKDPRLKTVAETLGRHLRQLTKSPKHTNSLIESLPYEALAPEELFHSIAAILQSYHGTRTHRNEYQKIAYIHRVLDWYKRDVWEVGEKHLRGTLGGSRSPGTHGSTETVDTERRVAITLVNDEGPSLRLSRFYKLPDPENRRSNPRRNDSEDDDQPTTTNAQLQPPRVTAYVLTNRRRVSLKNARYASQAIEQLNQHLPVTRSTLSGFELRHLIEAIENTHSPAWGETPLKVREETAAWAACRFYLSRTPKEIGKMIYSGDPENIQENLLAWRPGVGELLLPVIGPAHKAPTVAATGASKTVRVQPYYRLRCPKVLFAALRRLPKSDGRIFKHPREQEFNDLVARLRIQNQVNLTVTRIETTVATLINQLAPNDSAAGHYFVGEQPNQHNPAVYSVIPITQIQALFNQACAIVEKRSGHAGIQRTSSGFAILTSDDDPHVGSMHVPKLRAVRTAINKLKKTIETLCDKPVTGLASLHNTYTAYVVFFLLATSGMRAVSKLIPAEFDLDEPTGLCFVSDKDGFRYRNARLVWLHPEMVKQLTQYSEHVVRLRQHLALANPYMIDRLDNRAHIDALSSRLSPNRTADMEKMAEACPFIFMLTDPGCHISTVSPTDLVRYLGEEWNLKLGALRHFIRSYLLRCGVSGEVTNALLGHFDRGQAPWGQFSTLPPGLWRRLVGDTIEPLLKQLDLVALPSPLIGSRR